MFTNISRMCNADQLDRFICPSPQVFGTASMIWGVIGPARKLSQGQIYYSLVIFLLAGFLASAIKRIVRLKFNDVILKYLNWPVIFIAPAMPSKYVT